jgi:predicted amidohydrolase YtcJ
VANGKMTVPLDRNGCETCGLEEQGYFGKHLQKERKAKMAKIKSCRQCQYPMEKGIHTCQEDTATLDVFSDEQLEHELKRRKKPKFPVRLKTYVHDEAEDDENMDEFLEKYGEYWSEDTKDGVRRVNYEIELVYEVSEDGTTTLIEVDGKKVVQ